MRRVSPCGPERAVLSPAATPGIQGQQEHLYSLQDAPAIMPVPLLCMRDTPSAGGCALKKQAVPTRAVTRNRPGPTPIHVTCPAGSGALLRPHAEEHRGRRHSHRRRLGEASPGNFLPESSRLQSFGGRSHRFPLGPSGAKPWARRSSSCSGAARPRHT